MHTIMYATRSYVVDRQAAADLIRQAETLRATGEFEGAKTMLIEALRVEKGLQSEARLAA